ncbi:MAG: hypothetical protein U9N36_08310 [Euryarchaeota archaeon]|nr:hypothetical protein [Euryarchaeota archaeon]
MPVSKNLSQLLNSIIPPERVEVETFVAFVVARRSLRNLSVLTDEISTQELMQLVIESGSFDWLDASCEDVYSSDAGEAVKWLSES